MSLRNKHHNNISWPDLVFLAEAEKEAFADVQVITLYSYCLEKAQERGVHISLVEGKEFVEVFEDRVVVVVDSDVVDDEAINRALNLLTLMNNFHVGNKQEFGSKKTFGYLKLH